MTVECNGLPSLTDIGTLLFCQGWAGSGVIGKQRGRLLFNEQMAGRRMKQAHPDGGFRGTFEQHLLTCVIDTRAIHQFK